MSTRYLHNNAIAFDQQVNALLGGSPDETFSARCYRSARRDEAALLAGDTDAKQRWVILEAIVDTLFLPQDWLVKRRGEWTGARHCERAYQSEVARKHLPAAYANGLITRQA